MKNIRFRDRLHNVNDLGIECPFHKKQHNKWPIIVNSLVCYQCHSFVKAAGDFVVCKEDEKEKQSIFSNPPYK